MNRQQENKFAEGILEDPDQYPFAIFDLSDAIHEFLAQIDKETKQVRGLYRSGSRVIVIGSNADLVALRDMLIPLRPQDPKLGASFDRTLGKIERCIFDTNPQTALVN